MADLGLGESDLRLVGFERALAKVHHHGLREPVLPGAHDRLELLQRPDSCGVVESETGIIVFLHPFADGHVFFVHGPLSLQKE